VSPGDGSVCCPRWRSTYHSVVKLTKVSNTHRGSEHLDQDDVLRRRARAELPRSPKRAPARAHFRAMGIDPARLSGPIIGIASTWTQTMPCNLNHRQLAARVSAGVSQAGGLALEFNTIAVSDNQSQGTPGMRASLVSREVIADSIELMVHAHDFDGLVCIAGCDKTVPAALMALARVDKPAVVLYSGPMRAGHWRGRTVTIQDVWEAVGGVRDSLASVTELAELEAAACPGAGTCAGHFTANTMAVVLDCLGIAPIGAALVSADAEEERSSEANWIGRIAVELVRSESRARCFLDRRALLNAMAGVAATNT
jgi:dihydroxy-acid dehydratase